MAALAVAGITAVHPFGTNTAVMRPVSALPYYDSRDFTPHWSPVTHRVGPFHLVDQRNQPLTEKDLDGNIHVASFIFTSCPSVCPTLVQKLKPVQEALRGQSDVLMVSYSVTPLTDTPKVLAEFGPNLWCRAAETLGEKPLTGADER